MLIRARVLTSTDRMINPEAEIVWMLRRALA